jgi:hypothetical protein
VQEKRVMLTNIFYRTKKKNLKRMMFRFLTSILRIFVSKRKYPKFVVKKETYILYQLSSTYCNCSVGDGYSYQNCDSNPNTQTKMDDWPGFLQYSGV